MKQTIEIARQKGGLTVFEVVDALTRSSANLKNAGDRGQVDERSGLLLALSSRHHGSSPFVRNRSSQLTAPSLLDGSGRIASHSMCGRYAQRHPQTIEERSRTPIAPRFNISPGQTEGTPPILAVRMGIAGGRELTAMQWWLLPSWSKTRIIPYTTFNAAVEGIETKASFRASLKNRRCLIPADGFYEWFQENKRSPKRPHFIRRRDDGPFSFAGLWDRWESKKTDEVVESCTIITTPANELLRRIHPRCPVILPPEHHDEWLDPAVSDVSRLKRLLQPFCPRPFEMFEVSRFVSSTRHDGPQCIAPLSR